MFPRQIYLIFYLMSIASIVSIVFIVFAFIVFAAGGCLFDCPTAAIFPWKCARWHFQNADCRENAGKSRPMELKMFSTGRVSESAGLFMSCRVIYECFAVSQNKCIASGFVGGFLWVGINFLKKSSKKFGGKEKVRIFAARFGKSRSFPTEKREVH